MIRVIARDPLGDSGVGALVGDFQPDQIAPLLKLMEAVPGFRCAGGEYVRVAELVSGGPLQWVIGGGDRVVLEVLVEQHPDEDGNQDGWIYDSGSSIGIRPA